MPRIKNEYMSEAEKKETPRFTKDQLLESKRFSHERDVAAAVLEESRRYTIEEAEKKIQGFKERRVK